MKSIFYILLLTLIPAFAKSANIWIETESFEEKGGWVLDQQFIDQMGSSYLMAHGLGNPVKDATTNFTIKEKGTYYVYVRTYNWTSPWYKGCGAGKFQSSNPQLRAYMIQKRK